MQEAMARDTPEEKSCQIAGTVVESQVRQALKMYEHRPGREPARSLVLVGAAGRHALSRTEPARLEVRAV